MNQSRTPLVSVILPIYNVQGCLTQCLDSLVAQTLDNFEIIAVNDGSTDDSPNILDKYILAYPGLIFRFDKPNGGLSDARNFGMDKARGQWFAFVDSDDMLTHDYLELLTNKALETEADVVVCAHFNYQGLKGKAKPQALRTPDRFGYSVTERPELLIAARAYSWNKLYHRSLFESTGIQYPVGQVFEDSATTFNLLLNANKIEAVNIPLYYYRRDRGGSISGTFNKKFYDIFKSFDSILSYFDEHAAPGVFDAEITEIMRRSAFARVYALRNFDSSPQALEFVAAVYAYLDEHSPDWANNKYFKQQRESSDADFNEFREAQPSQETMLALLKTWWAQPRPAGIPVESGTPLFQELQRASLEVLLSIDQICREHGLTYYLLGGTLIGAIRHHGFIPWDDDIDISMPRADYQRFLKIMGKRELHGCILFHQSTYPKYHLSFAKVVTTKKTGFWVSHIPVPEKFGGPRVDVFPLDRVIPVETESRRSDMRWWRDILLLKANYFPDKSKRRKKWRVRASKVFPFWFLQRWIQHLYKHYAHDPEATCLVNFASSYEIPREIVPAKAYGTPRYIEFEGHQLPVPEDAELVLRTIFGDDFMTLPPEPMRVTGHLPLWRDPSKQLGEQ